VQRSWPSPSATFSQACISALASSKSGKGSDAVPPSNEIIVKHPEILGGIAVFRGTRVPFKNLLDYLEGGHTLDEFLEQFPSVTRETAIGALEQAKVRSWTLEIRNGREVE
jgi:uncharacterized protein (DUF433 family)